MGALRHDQIDNRMVTESAWPSFPTFAPDYEQRFATYCDYKKDKHGPTRAQITANKVVRDWIDSYEEDSPFDYIFGNNQGIRTKAKHDFQEYVAKCLLIESGIDLDLDTAVEILGEI